MKNFVKLNTTKRHRQKPRILICTPEITELPEGMGNAANYIRAKGGGLGDISAGLIRYLYEDGRFQLHVALPKYDMKIRDLARVGFRELDVLTQILHRKGIHLVTDSAFSHVEDVYGEMETSPRVRRALAFQRCIINHLLDEIRPDVVHCNDWMTGLVPPAARTKGIKSLFTLHNVFTEKETPQNIDYSGIDVRRFLSSLYFENFPGDSQWDWTKNRIDFAASGIHAADMVNTVSKTFLEEIVNDDFDKIIPPSIRHAVKEKYAQKCALGILNAPNDSIDPTVSRYIALYGIKDVVEKKRLNKRKFQLKMGLNHDLEAPLFFWPSRLYPQKGPELLFKIARTWVESHGIQLGVVANGDPVIVEIFKSLERVCKGRIAYHTFSENLSELGKAAADFVLMPSLYEPCGLPQMECPRFGTLPVARLTGGIKDTVFEIDPVNGHGNGFTFKDFTTTALEGAMDRAVAFFKQPEEKKRNIIQRIMQDSFHCHTLANTAKEYIQIYEALSNGDTPDSSTKS